MESRRLKKPVVYLLYGLGFVLLVSVSFFIEGLFNGNKLDDDTTYVSETIFDDAQPVVADDYKIIRPYNDSEIKVLFGFYDYRGEEADQQKSILVYNNTYMQSSGVTYGGKDSFDIVSILDGTVLTVKQDELLGNIVEVSHSNGIISVYQSLGKVNVKVNDTVKQGQIIGTGGTSNINTEIGSNLYFELIINGNIVNPESYYDKLVSEI